MYKVAIVILNWNGAGMLEAFLPSVIEQAGEEVAVYVADNGSTDSSVELVRSRFPQVHLILLDKNYGFAEGYNLALRQVEATYVVLLNSDVEVTPGWLAPLVEYMDNHPDTAACQPKILSWHQKNMFEYAGAAGGYIDKYGYPFCRGRIMHVVEEDCGQYNTIAPVFWATGAALFIRKEVYTSVGGLDPYFFAHMEEIDLCWRLRSRGWQIVCIPQSTVYHVGGATLKKENPRKTFLNFRNNLLMLYKNLPQAELRKTMTVRCVLDYLAAINFLLKGERANAAAVLQARKEYNRIKADFAGQRALNLSLTTTRKIPQRIQKSILVQFYLRGRKSFGKLSTNDHEQKNEINKKTMGHAIPPTPD